MIANLYGQETRAERTPARSLLGLASKKKIGLPRVVTSWGQIGGNPNEIVEAITR